MTENNGNRFSRSYDVQQLVERLMITKVGDVLSYAEIDKIIGGDHRAPKYSSRVQSARRIVQKEKQMLFGPIDEGLQRLADAEIVKAATASVAKIRRESIRGAKKLACADYDKLTPDEQRKHLATASHLGILAECSRPTTVKAIAARVEVENKKLTFDETLKAFRE